MSQALQTIRGMVDIPPEQTPLWQQLEQTLRLICQQFTLQEIRFPIVEKTELFARSVGETSDIVGKEMYTFADRNDDSLSLRPEGTASCVRAAIQLGLLHHSPIQRLWYQGPMFRHERPQRGRQRQFHQFGVEYFGMHTPQADTELLLISHQLWKQLGLDQHIRLEINFLGNTDERAAHRQALVDFLQPHRASLSEEAQQRLDRNPLRLLDSKDPELQALLSGAPQLTDFLGTDSLAHFNTIQQHLNQCGVQFTVNPSLVRGLDYYTGCVFEWITDELGAQGAVAAGGRYDGLVATLGGRDSAAAGFAVGLERVLELLNQHQPVSTAHSGAYMIVLDDSAYDYAFEVSRQLRARGVTTTLDTQGGSSKSQFKRADKSLAKHAVIIGQDELNQQSLTLKSLREAQDQTTLALADALDTLTGDC